MYGHETHHQNHEARNFSEKIHKESEIKVNRCYQCGKCSAGCPVAFKMDFPPSVILRMLQTGTKENEEKVLTSFTIWLCLACETCVCRCPMEVDLPVLMDFLRAEAMRRDLINPKARDILSFHNSFLSSVENNGRLFEVGLIANYKFRTMHLFQDLTVAPKMLMKGKLGLLPPEMHGKQEIAKIFSKTLRKEEKTK